MSLPRELIGRVHDIDSHEMLPVSMWEESFGNGGALLAGLFLSQKEMVSSANELNEFLAEVDGDTLEITDGSVWRREGWEGSGCRAPGVIDMTRRLEVLDFMGVERTNIFPSFALMGLTLSCASAEMVESLWGELPEGVDGSVLRQLGGQICGSWNDWAIAHAKVDADRLRMVAILDTSDFDGLMAETERVLAGDVRSFWIPPSVPPGGRSPADRALSPFWSLLEEADATLYTHLAFEDFLRSVKWRQAPEFATDQVKSAEFPVDPYSFATQHMVVENFFATMILGGVFERHPGLRFGVLEAGASWLGPMAENLDKWAGVFKRRMAGTLSMAPSEYISRHLRVAPYIFEPVEKFVNRYGLEDVYVFCSDYPHQEGGTDQLETHAKNVSALGPGFTQKYFVDNARLLMPSLA